MNLEALRKEKKLSRMDIASELGVTYQAYSKWERREAMPTADKLPKLAQIFGCTIDDLFEQTDNYKY